MPIPATDPRWLHAQAVVGRLREAIARVIVGQQRVVDGLLVGLLADGHVLLEGMPGLAKTLAVKTLAEASGASFRRIQFTPDLLPADVVGTLVYEPREGRFTTRTGPIFANVVLADEVNRAPAKVQSALLEAMEERQVTIGEESLRLPDPFLVLATQNPIEQEGTYPLPEAQVDRFLLKVVVGYPTREEERRILEAHVRLGRRRPPLEPVTSPAEVLTLRAAVDGVYLDEKVKEYVLDLVAATRDPEAFRLPLAAWIEHGASPRATLFLTVASKARALLSGRPYVTPQDVKDVGADVLRHRIVVTYEAEAEDVTADEIVRRIFDAVPVP